MLEGLRSLPRSGAQPSFGRLWPTAIACLVLCSTAGCQKKVEMPAAVAPEVLVMTVTPRTTPLSVELVSEIRAFREVELRPQVSGVVARKLFEPGQRVREGELLFTIDPRNYDEAVINAQANLAEAQANLARVRQDIVRYKPLLADNAIPRQTYDQAVAQEQQYKAIVDARRSNVASASVQRGYADVRSPISGQIGLQQIEVGGLATAGQTVLATVSTLNPVAAYFSVSEVSYLTFVRKNGAAAAGADGHVKAPPVDLILADGTLYPHQGTIDFADRALSSTTGTLQLRAVFPNNENLLRPGMNARVRIVYDVEKDAILVPQRAVTELLGKYFVSVVGADNKVEQVAVTTGPRLGEFWVVRGGLKGGEVVITDGLQTAKAGQVVVPKPMPAGDAVAPAQP